MRIIGGKYAGRVLHVPAGMNLRPTTERAKEALFNILENQIDWDGLRVLELYAGTGALGFEAHSRGAKVTLVEKNPKHCRFISSAIARLGIEDGVSLINTDARVFVNRCSERFHLIIADPPYDDANQSDTIEKILGIPLLEPNGLLVWEHRTGMSFNMLQPERTKIYGESAFSFFKA